MKGIKVDENLVLMNCVSEAFPEKSIDVSEMTKIAKIMKTAYEKDVKESTRNYATLFVAEYNEDFENLKTMSYMCGSKDILYSGETCALTRFIKFWYGGTGASIPDVWEHRYFIWLK